MASNSTQATCGLCSQLYSDPRMLQCLHSFCKKCLEKEFQEKDSTKSNLQIQCPTCDHPTTLHNGVDSLPKQLHLRHRAERSLSVSKVNSEDSLCERCLDENQAVTFCCNCLQLLCQDCQEDHRRSRTTHTHTLFNASSSNEDTDSSSTEVFVEHKPIMCSVHNDEVLKFYCSTCSVLICRDCVMVEHADHRYNRVEKVAGAERTALEGLKNDVESAKSRIEEALERISTVKSEFHSKQEKVDKLVRDTFEQLQKQLVSRKEELLLQSSELSRDKLKSLLSQKAQLKALQGQLSLVCDLVTDATQLYTDTEMLAITGALRNQVQGFIKQVESCHLEPCDTNLIPVFFSLDSTSLSSAISKVGVVTSGCCPSECTASIQIPRAIVNRERKILVTLRDQWGKPYSNEREEVCASVTYDGSQLDPPPTVVESGNGTYTISFTPTSTGQHIVDITVCNQPIKHSPFSLHVRKHRDYRTLSSYQQCFSVNGTAWTSTISEKNEVYVAVGGTHCIAVFDYSGYCMRTIGKRGSGKGQFNSPSGIVLRNGSLYVAEYHNHRVQLMNTLGDFVTMFGSHGRGDGELNGPRSLVLDSSRDILFVSDSGNNRVCVFNTDGTFAYHISGDESNGSDLNNPWGLAFDHLGQLHVVCYNSHCVKVFTSDGEYVRQYGGGRMTCPSGIAIDEEGYTFVSEYGGRFYRLLVFNCDRQLIHSIQNFTSPAGLSIDREGCVYVADHSNNRVLKY